MYRLADIVESFKGLVGWEPENLTLDEEIMNSDSGLYFQEAHPMLTLRAVRSIMPDDFIKRYPEWNADTVYAKDVIVSSGNKAYRSLVSENSGGLLDADSWELFDPINDYLSSLETRGIKKVITRFVRDKVVGMESKNIIDRRCLFDGTGRIENRIENNGRLVGFEITPLRSDGVTVKLDRIGIQFTGNTGPVKFYLFNSSQKEPVATWEFEYTKGNGTFMWFDLSDVYLPYVNDTMDAGGSWYLVYNQSSLPDYMEAVNFGRDWSREPCGSCNKGDAQLYRVMSKYVDFSPFYVDVEDWDETLWDIQGNMYSNTLNYGINLMFSVGCDISDIMIGERLDFANAIQLQVATEALRALALNPEVNVNRVQYNADRDNILYETDGNGQGIRGLNGELEKAYKALSFDTSGLSEVCLPCKKKGIRFGSI